MALKNLSFGTIAVTCLVLLSIAVATGLYALLSPLLSAL